MVDIEKDVKEQIDNMTYRSMLSIWRFAKSGHPLITKPVGDYFAEVMATKKEALGPGEAVQASKDIGWEN